MVDSGHIGSELFPEISESAGERIQKLQLAFRESVGEVHLTKAQKRLLRRKRQYKRIEEAAIQVRDQSCREVLAIDEKLAVAKETVEELQAKNRKKNLYIEELKKRREQQVSRLRGENTDLKLQLQRCSGKEGTCSQEGSSVSSP